MSSIALAQLGITSDVFFDLSAREFYYAMESVRETKRMEMQHHFEVARYTAVAIINHTSTILKDRIQDERCAFPLPWDEKVLPKLQTQEDLTKSIMGIASAFGAVKSDRKPGDPPTVLAPQHRK